MNPQGRDIAHATSAPADPQAAGPITPATPAAKGVQELLSRAVTDLTSPGKRADLITLLARHDRDHLADSAGPRWRNDWSDVDAAAEAFQNAWQARFGLTFHVDDKVPMVFTEPSVHVSGMDDPAPPVDPATTAPATVPAGHAAPMEVTIYEPGRRYSAVVRLSREGTGDAPWHIDLPDAVTAAALHVSLLRHLNAIVANQSRWPTDVDQAYIYVAGHALASLTDADATMRR